MHVSEFLNAKCLVQVAHPWRLWTFCGRCFICWRECPCEWSMPELTGHKVGTFAWRTFDKEGKERLGHHIISHAKAWFSCKFLDTALSPNHHTTNETQGERCWRMLKTCSIETPDSSSLSSNITVWSRFGRQGSLVSILQIILEIR